MKLAVATGVALAGCSLFAAIQVKVEQDRESALYACGETASFNVCPSSDKAIVNCVGAGHCSFNAWILENRGKPSWLDYNAWLRMCDPVSHDVVFRNNRFAKPLCLGGRAAHNKLLPEGVNGGIVIE